jgi:hypothetical protein
MHRFNMAHRKAAREVFPAAVKARTPISCPDGKATSSCRRRRVSQKGTVLAWQLWE